MEISNVLRHKAVAVEPKDAEEMMEPLAFQAFYERTHAPLRAYLVRMTRSHQLAEDLAQESYIRMLQAAPRDDNPSQLRGYLYRTATNLFTDNWRRRWREQPLPETNDGEPSGEMQVVDVDLGRALDRLKQKERAMLWLAYVEGFDHREIGEIFRVNERSVRVMLFRARKKVARVLEKMGRKEGSA